VRKNNFSNGAGAITDRTLEKQAFLIIPEGVAEVIFAHRLILQRWVRTPIARKWLVSQGF